MVNTYAPIFRGVDARGGRKLYTNRHTHTHAGQPQVTIIGERAKRERASLLSCKLRFAIYIYITRNRSLSNIGRARCAAINSDLKKFIISKYINYTIGINDNNCVFVCNLILGW